MSPRFDTADSGTPRPEENRPPALPERQNADYGKLEEKVSSLAAAVTRWESELESSASRATRLEGAFTVLLSSLEGWKSDIREVASRTEARVLRGLEVIDSRISRVQPGGSPLDSGEILDAIQKLERAFGERIAMVEQDITAVRTSTGPIEGLDILGRRLEGIEKKVSSSDTALAGRLGASFEILERRLSSIEQRLSTPEPDLAERLGASLDTLGTRLGALEEKLSTPDPQLTSRLAGTFEALERRLLSIEQKVSGDTDTSQIASLETKVAAGQTALTSKLETVLAEADENSATQLRYLGSLEELQASVAKRLHALEAVVKNPLDEQQWERLAKGLEFLDVRLAQSLDSVSSKLDAAIASLTTTLDARTASGQEANLKSAERLWRALRGLEDQITGSYQLVRQSQERLEASTANVSNALEELRAVHGARASHTEKLLMEGLENLDGRFAQNLMNVSERLGTAIFGLNKATEEWRSDLANSTEESEERLTARIGQVETKLARDLKTGLEALGRREERMLALILGGGAAATPMPVEETPKARE